MTTLHLHHLEISRSFRIVWLLEELGLDYQLSLYKRHQDLAPPELQAVHPMGKAPILQDGDKTLLESACIIEYLIDFYDNPTSLTQGKALRPDYGSPAYEQYRYWLHFAESSFMPLRIVHLIFTILAKQSPFGIKQVARLLHRKIDQRYLQPTLLQQLRLLEQHLSTNDWLAGTQFTGADIQLEFAVNIMNQNSAALSDYPAIQQWLIRCQQRPAYAQAVAKGGSPVVRLV